MPCHASQPRHELPPSPAHRTAFRAEYHVGKMELHKHRRVSGSDILLKPATLPAPHEHRPACRGCNVVEGLDGRLMPCRSQGQLRLAGTGCIEAVHDMWTAELRTTASAFRLPRLMCSRRVGAMCVNTGLVHRETA